MTTVKILEDSQLKEASSKATKGRLIKGTYSKVAKGLPMPINNNQIGDKTSRMVQTTLAHSTMAEATEILTLP